MSGTPEGSRGLFYEGGRNGILLIHGLSGTPVELRYIASGLARQGYTVSCPELAGHCRTLEELRRTSWQDWYGGVDMELRKLAECCERIIVGGLSMGAVLSLLLASRRPELVRASVLYSPTLWLDGWGVPWGFKFFRLLRHRWAADLISCSERPPYGIKDQRLRSFVAEAIHSGDPSKVGFLTIPGGLMLELRWLVDVVRGELARITRPVLILHPREDDRASLGNTAYLEKHLGGQVEKVVLDDSYHVITLDRQRDLVLQKTLSFAECVFGASTLREKSGGIEGAVVAA
jgi:carboxylesterase